MWSQESCAGEVDMCDSCVRTVAFSTSFAVFNTSVGAITDRSRSAKDTDPYFKSKFYVEDTVHRKSLVSLPNGLGKLGERAHDRNKTLPLHGFEPTTSSSPSSVLPLSYQRYTL